ncbi:MAG: prolyl aminopeptidase [Gammaproteobacteria bacterium]
MRSLYPSIEPFATEHLPVDESHTLYLERCGSAGGIPVLFLHGGPGAGCAPTHRRFFDPARYQIILFDQRGSGRSTPHASLENNTTRDLIEDIEKIRSHLGIERWLVFGGSWGSTLALAYAEQFPEKVTGLVLRGIFLCRKQDIHWFYQHGTSRLFPDYWQDYLEPIAESERHDLVSAYYRILTGPDPEKRLAAAKAWSLWEGRTATLLPDPATEDYFSGPDFALSLARIECHYFMHDSFLEENQLIQNASKLRSIPGVIVHGRYDVICPMDGALALKAAWPEAELVIVPDAGHSATEPGIATALISATDQFAAVLSGADNRN